MAVHGRRFYTVGQGGGLMIHELDGAGFPWLVSRSPVEGLKFGSRDDSGSIAVSENHTAVHHGEFLELYAAPSKKR